MHLVCQAGATAQYSRMLPPQEDSIRTRSSLLRRIKRWDDQTSWRDFYGTYKRILRGVALRSGLSEAEADDVIQETFLEVAKKMPAFEYDPQRGSFKAWLRKLTRWRILDQLRKRQRGPASLPPRRPAGFGTALTDSVPAPAGTSLQARLDKEWQTELMQAAFRNVRRRADPEKLQIFDLYVRREWPAQKVARLLGLSLNQVYLAKHRITEMLKAEVKRLTQGRGFRRRSGS